MAQSEIVRVVYRKIKDTLGSSSIDIQSVMSACLAAMKLVERVPQLDGSEKKAIVQQVVKMIVNDSSLSPETRATVDNLIDNILPVVIDIVIASENGALKIVRRGCARCV